MAAEPSTPRSRTLAFVLASAFVTLALVSERAAAAPTATDRARELDQRAVAAYLDGRFQEAIDRLLEAITLAPSEPLLYLNLGRVYEAMRDRPRAVEAYERYLALAPAAKERLVLERRIADLRRELDDAAADRAKTSDTIHAPAARPESELISEGEKSRAVLVRLDDAGAPRVDEQSSAAKGTDARGVIGWGLLGLGTLSLATFGVIELVAQSEYRSIRDGCGATHSCSSNEVSPTQTKFDLAKVSVVVAAGSLAVGIPLVVFRPKTRTGSAAVVDAAPLSTGGGLRLRAAF